MIGFYATWDVPLIFSRRPSVKLHFELPILACILLSSTAVQAFPGDSILKELRSTGDEQVNIDPSMMGQVAIERSEEDLLTRALKELKGNNLDEAINCLARLKDRFPDNDDYMLMYRTAVRKKNSSDGDSQRWYNYERTIENKSNESKAAGGAAANTAEAPLPPQRTVLSTPSSSPRVSQLKKATWLALTTGKNKSANAGRMHPLRNLFENKDNRE
jgi:hypothetical protein